MCKLMLGINFEESKVSPNLFVVNKSVFESEKDGTVVFDWKDFKNPKSKAFKSTSEAIDYMALQSQSKGLFGVHTRTATSGLLTEDNLHFWIKSGYSFAHNGLVVQLSGASQKDSDSKLFFEILLRKLKRREKHSKNLKVKTKAKIIRGLMDEMNFTGVAFLIDIKRKLLYLLGTRDIDIYSDTQSFITFASFTASLHYQKIINYAGVEFITTGLALPIFHNTLPEGIYVYDIKNRAIIYKEEFSDTYEFYNQKNYGFAFDKSIESNDQNFTEPNFSREVSFEPDIKPINKKQYLVPPTPITNPLPKAYETSDDYLRRKGYLAD